MYVIKSLRKPIYFKDTFKWPLDSFDDCEEKHVPIKENGFTSESIFKKI